jgi:hypothetical protein
LAQRGRAGEQFAESLNFYRLKEQPHPTSPAEQGDDD